MEEKKEGSKVEEELITLNRLLLEAIVAGDWSVYSALSDPSLTAFEPEAVGMATATFNCISFRLFFPGHLVEGLPFHEFYFKTRKQQEYGNN